MSNITKSTKREINYSELKGSRDWKNEHLREKSARTLESAPLMPQPDEYMFIPQNSESLVEYNTYFSISNIFRVYSSGIDTKIDRILIDRNPEELSSRVENILDSSKSIEEIKHEYQISSTSTWEIERAKKARFNRDCVKPITYRIFDFHYTYFDSRVLSRARENVMQHMLDGKNIGLITTRQMSQRDREWALIGVTNRMIERCSISNYTREGNYLFPLWIKVEWPRSMYTANISELAYQTLCKSTGLKWIEDGLEKEELNHEACYDRTEMFGPHDMLAYIISILHSQTYRSRYADFLKRDFSKIPLKPSRNLFQELSNLGRELISLQLMKSAELNQFVTTVVGPSDFQFQVEKTFYSDETVWIDKAKTRGFRGVPECVWNFRIGGYQVCEKWLKDRQAKGGKNPRPGRVLTNKDIDHYQKIVVALSETIRIMSEIDKVIEEHGGWPGAFQGGESSQYQDGSEEGSSDMPQAADSGDDGYKANN